MSTETSWGKNYYSAPCSCDWVGTIDECVMLGPTIPPPTDGCFQRLNARCKELVTKGPMNGLCHWMPFSQKGPSLDTDPEHCFCQPQVAARDGLKVDLGTCDDAPTFEERSACRRRIEAQCFDRWPKWIAP